ncbi:hypothetical protein FQA39_LY02082 [Lamprigera yunnana]|nr:hypothetical protein FQA39_LY02082 [Lamprigera yunnana]
MVWCSFFGSDEKNLTAVEDIVPIPTLDALRNSLPFDSMPGPQSIRLLAKLWSIVPLQGKQVEFVQNIAGADRLFSYLNWYDNQTLFKRMIREYGPIVRLQGPFGGNVIVMLRLEDAMNLTKNEGQFPIRSSIDSLEQYRLECRRYKQAGPFLTNGPGWKKLRSVLENRIKVYVDDQSKVIDEVSEKFIERILCVRNKQEKVPHTFYSEINKWSLECLCSILLNKRLGFLDESYLSVSSEPARILDGVQETVAAIRSCEFGFHLWRLVETSGWKRLVKNCDVFDTIFNKYIYKAQETLRQKMENEGNVIPEKVTFLESLLLKEELSVEDVLTVLLDMIIIGSTALTHSVAFLLYHLSRYPSAQRKLYNEVMKPTQVDTSQMSYLEACIKESLRLKQPIPLISRMVSEDCLIRNYQVPKGTHVLIPIQTYSNKEEYFEDALRFQPERWLHEDLKLNDFDLSTLSFGFGSRSCFAKGLAKMHIGILMTKIIQKFRLEYEYGEIKSTNRMLATPDRSLRFTFVDRI